MFSDAGGVFSACLSGMQEIERGSRTRRTADRDGRFRIFLERAFYAGCGICGVGISHGFHHKDRGGNRSTESESVSIADFPALNAGLNTLSTIFIAAGWWFISREQKRRHITCMVAALVTSSAFLTCYLIYHFNVGSVRFTEQGWSRAVYFPLLISHLILAIVVVPMIVMTVVPALRSRFDRHRKFGKWTMPVWLYVSITGVLVYLMLYIWFPSTAAPVR